MLSVYSFVEPPAAIPNVAGVDGAPLECEHTTRLDAVVSRHEAPIAPQEAAIVAHAAVVEALAGSNDAVLPARFGGGYRDSDSLRRELGERATELAAALGRVRGCVELGVRVLAPARQAEPTASGTDYMSARLEHRREVERVA